MRDNGGSKGGTSRMRILFLEDEEAIRGFVRINLKRNGMEVTEAEDGETALELAKIGRSSF